MAHTTLKLVFQSLSLFSLLLLTQKSMAYEFKVGGSNGWMPPSDPYTNSLNQWAEKNRFQIGDSLVFVYSANKDSLLYVSQNDYLGCNTTTPIQKFTDGRTVFNLDHSGPYYFISGVRDNCLKNEKVTVVVLADRTKNATAPSPQTPAAPPPSNATGSPALTPSNANATAPAAPPPSETAASSPPSPAPAGETPPSPPPNGAVEMNPAPAPAGASKPKKNDASSTVMNFFVLMAAFVGSSVFSVL